MRVTPSKTMIPIKRSFFHQQMVARESISSGLEALKGIYQSIRLAQVCCDHINYILLVF